jgi:hypothetical protein
MKQSDVHSYDEAKVNLSGCGIAFESAMPWRPARGCS